MNSYQTINAAYREAGIPVREAVEFGRLYEGTVVAPASAGRWLAEALVQRQDTRLMSLGGIAAAKAGAQIRGDRVQGYRYTVQWLPKDDGYTNLDGSAWFGPGWYVTRLSDGFLWDGPFSDSRDAYHVRDRREAE